MQTFIYDNTTCCLCNINNNQIWNYACEACLDAAISAGCLKEGQIVSIPSSNDGTPIEGDACRLWLNNASNGMIPVVNGTTSAFNTMKATDMTYTSATCTLNVTNLTATGCINGIPYNCYAQTCDVSTAESCACVYTDTRECCIRTDVCAYACCCAKVCAECCGAAAACSYFEGCFADCFACCIAEWWTCNKGNINTSDPGRDNSLWVN